MNRLTLMGRLTADPDLRSTSSGKSVCQFTLAVDRPFKNADGSLSPQIRKVGADK